MSEQFRWSRLVGTRTASVMWRLSCATAVGSWHCLTLRPLQLLQPGQGSTGRALWNDEETGMMDRCRNALLKKAVGTIAEGARDERTMS